MTRQSRLMGRVLGASALLGLSFALSAAIGPAAANKVGVAAAVNPDAFSSLAGAPKSQLNIGKSIFFNERIATTTSGLVQVLLVDGSTFTVGPDSDLVIDKFVYDPNKGTGQIAASFSKGVMRFVGGKISKSDNAVTIKTPAGAMAVRGCIILTQVNPATQTTAPSVAAILVFGDYLKMANRVIFDNGTGIFISATGNAEVRKATAADIGGMLAGLSNSNNQNNNGDASSKTNTGTALQMVDTASLNELIQNANTQTVVADSTKVEVPAPPEPTQVTMRVLSAPNTYTAYGTNFEDPASSGILGGDDNPDVQVDDFVWTFNLENDRLVGTVEGLIESFEGGTGPMTRADVDFPAVLDCVSGICAVTPANHATITQDGETDTFVGLAVLKPDFFAYHLVEFQEPDIGLQTNALNNNISGGQVYHDPLLIFGGKGYDFGTPSGKTYALVLTPDIIQLAGGALAPFASAASSPAVDPTKPLPSISPLLYLETDSNPQSNAVWLQTSLYINTTPDDPLTEGNDFDQQSFVNVALGGVENGGLFGARRGGAQVDVYQYGGDSCEGPCEGYTSREALAFTGDIATLAGPDGSHFMGSDDPNIVIGFDSTGTAHNIGRDIPLDPNSSSVENQSGSTYHIGVGLGTLPQQDQTLNGDYKGYAAGMVQSAVPANNFANVVASRSPDDFGITFDNTTNTLSASLNVYDVQHTDSATGRYSLGFGDNSDSTGRSAYIDNLHYAAIESGSNQVSNWGADGFTPYQNTVATSYLVSGEQLNVTEFFPDTFEADDNGYRPFCTNCQFLQWGAWGSRVAFVDGTQDNPNATQYVDNVHLGWWVAGDRATPLELNALDPPVDVDTIAALGVQAAYAGHVIGNVANNLNGQGWKTYVAAGDLAMNWSFAQRAGDLTISNFDSRSYSTNPGNVPGGLTQPNLSINQFGGDLHQIGGTPIAGMTGSATGSFVRPLDQAGVPSGVMGNFDVGSAAYKATGIFAGSKP